MKEFDRHSFQKQVLLEEIGVLGQQKLTDARVVVIGAGGLGCPALQYLAAAGVGHITIIDGDRIERSNLPRQILFGEKDINAFKATTAKQVLSEKYPCLTIQAVTEFLTLSNALTVLKDADVVVDCTDNFTSRYLINDACIQLQLPFVFGAIFKFEGQLAVFNHNNSASYRCVFPDLPKEKSQPDCNDTGVLGILPGIIGTMQATEAIKLIVGMDGLMDSHLLTYNALRQEIRKIQLPKRNETLCKSIASSPLSSENQSCSSVQEISWNALDTHFFRQIIDVRELNEQPESPDQTTHKIPLSEMNQHISQLDEELPTAIFCQSGKRSSKAAALLLEYNFKHVVSIQNGVQNLILQST